ncbi:hypothetical protein [Catenuloplanes indicus]|uniref:Uncharacterized protein n=1 Tax=Catenuloplanes indicus TaxID=137267 RepID=A0AAE3VX14_9ACTN|nr:hypothetical protein [Catenuloplanes indicus]MDQ0364852.1 hypothetical protein [Catenuloplanes indicus]
MDELDRLLAETMHDAAGRAPSDDGLLRGVHTRSRVLRRRRMITTSVSAVVAVVAVGVPVAAVLTTRPEPVVPPAATAPAVPPSPTAAASASPSPPAAPPSSGPPSPSAPPPESEAPAGTAVTLAEGWTAPVFPYTLPPADDRRTPVATMSGGDLIGFFETTDPAHEADITVTVSGVRPSFGTPGTETARQVRGRAGTLRTVDVQPARQLTLYWQESPGRWISLTTDDTYTPDQVVEWAGALSEASIAVQPPFRLGVSPAGLTTTTVTKSRMIFTGPGDVSLILRKRQQLTGTNQTINGYAAALTRDDAGARLTIDVDDWDATLEITVTGGLTITDADLLRLGTGVQLLTRSNPE